MSDYCDRSDNRAEPRARLIHRPVLVETDQFAAFCLAKNISPSGMMVQFSNDCALNAPVVVHFSDFYSIRGSILWSSNGAIGIKFEAALDVQRTLADLALTRQRGKVNRGLRLAIKVRGEIIYQGRTVPVELVDISQRGVKLRSPFVGEGDEVILKINGLDPRRAIARWAEGGFAGLHFLRPLDFVRLAEWAVRAQTVEFSRTMSSEDRRKA